MKSVQGTPISAGVAVGKVYLKKDNLSEVILEKDKNREEEKERYRRARAEAAGQLDEIYKQMADRNGQEQAAIFLAQKEILLDMEFISGVEHIIDELGCGAEWAVSEVQKQYVELFESLEQEYMRERAADVKDTGMRVLRLLQGSSGFHLSSLTEPVILISKDLTPSDTAQMKPELILGIITETGGPTSHAAIIARMLGIPFCICRDITSLVREAQIIAFDGETGVIELEVTETIKNIYIDRSEALRRKQLQLQELVGAASVTVDGYRMKLAGNIGTPKDAWQVIKQDGEAIGLFRSEFLYMDREGLPTEEEQFLAYKEVAEAMGDRPVVIRTLDIGGDKELAYLAIPREENPFLGCRAIRLCLRRVDMWKAQLRALLRAGIHGNIQIMFPMIVSLEELRQAKQILEEAKDELRQEGIPFREDIAVGMMMETPAAAVMADSFAPEVDFFSIGTNDLIQYTMAVDRMNGDVAHLYSQYDPAVLRLIKHIADSAHRNGIWTGICGEAAADSKLLPFWIGVGIDELSMSPGSILKTRQKLRELNKTECEKEADRILGLKSAKEIEAALSIS